MWRRTHIHETTSNQGHAVTCAAQAPRPRPTKALVVGTSGMTTRWAGPSTTSVSPEGPPLLALMLLDDAQQQQVGQLHHRRNDLQ